MASSACTQQHSEKNNYTVAGNSKGSAINCPIDMTFLAHSSHTVRIFMNASTLHGLLQAFL